MDDYEDLRMRLIEARQDNDIENQKLMLEGVMDLVEIAKRSLKMEIEVTYEQLIRNVLPIEYWPDPDGDIYEPAREPFDATLRAYVPPQTELIDTASYGPAVSQPDGIPPVTNEDIEDELRDLPPLPPELAEVDTPATAEAIVRPRDLNLSAPDLDNLDLGGTGRAEEDIATAIATLEMQMQLRAEGLSDGNALRGANFLTSFVVNEG